MTGFIQEVASFLFRLKRNVKEKVSGKKARGARGKASGYGRSYRPQGEKTNVSALALSRPRREWGVKTRLYEEGFPAVGYRYEPVRRCRPDTVVPTLIDWERFLR
jgi:hypothetical protein